MTKLLTPQAIDMIAKLDLTDKVNALIREAVFAAIDPVEEKKPEPELPFPEPRKPKKNGNIHRTFKKRRPDVCSEKVLSLVDLKVKPRPGLARSLYGFCQKTLLPVYRRTEAADWCYLRPSSPNRMCKQPKSVWLQHPRENLWFGVYNRKTKKSTYYTLADLHKEWAGL